MLDVSLAIAHHLLIFTLFGVIVCEFLIVRAGMDRAGIERVAKIDIWYGILAGLILVVGFGRATAAAKGWLYYEHNIFFWAKIGAFLMIGLLSIVPTIEFIKWRRAGGIPSAKQITAVRRYVHAELGLFILLPIFAALMSRGYGELVGH